MIGKYHKGRGAQINPKNKFRALEYVEEHHEGIDENASINHARADLTKGGNHFSFCQV